MTITSVIWLVALFLGFSGVLFILYSAIAAGTRSVWEPLEKWSGFASTLLTLLGTMLTVATIYLKPSAPLPPLPINAGVSGPIILLACAIALYYLFREHSLPQALVSGFGLLAIAVALLRLFPYRP